MNVYSNFVKRSSPPFDRPGEAMASALEENAPAHVRSRPQWLTDLLDLSQKTLAKGLSSKIEGLIKKPAACNGASRGPDLDFEPSAI